MNPIMAAVVAVATAAIPAPAPDNSDVPAAPTTHTIRFDMGGSIQEFADKYSAWADAKDHVEIRGECVSACTMALGMIDRDLMCASKNGMFGFHSASAEDQYSAEGTQVLWHLYPDDVREVLTAKGMGENVEHPTLIWIPATTFLKECK